MDRIEGTTRVVGLLGWPVSHTLSPRVQNAAFRAAGLDWVYVALPVEPARVGEAVRGLRALGFAGANVTIPHKTAVIEFLDEVDEVAVAADAVNTIAVRDGRLVGTSTDGLALTSSLLRTAGEAAVVLGAGGAAKSAAAALRAAGAAVRICSRRDPDWPPDVSDATILVNATPLKEELVVAPLPHQQVADFAYLDGRPTALVAAARAANCPVVVDGLELLIRQGAAGFEFWTGVPAPLDAMRAALRD